MTASLRIEQVRLRLGGVSILTGVNAVVRPDIVTAFIGPNGAGKTTLFHAVAGDVRVDAGKILLGDRDITGMPPWRVAALGLGRVFQDIRLFNNLTVEENLLVALHGDSFALIGRRLGVSSVLAGEQHQDDLQELLRLGGLDLDRSRKAYELSFGQQKILAIIRSLASRPSLLLLDEPTSGIRGAHVDLVAGLLRAARARTGMTVALIEHNMAFVRELADWVSLMNEGRVIDEGTPDDVLAKRQNQELCIGL